MQVGWHAVCAYVRFVGMGDGGAWVILLKARREKHQRCRTLVWRRVWACEMRWAWDILGGKINEEQL